MTSDSIRMHTGQTTTSIPQGAVVEVDQVTVNQILNMFQG